MKADNEDERNWRTVTLCREEIDGIDNEIISLLARRQEVAAVIGRTKKNLGVQVFDPAREQQVLKKVTSKKQGKLTKEAVRHIFNEIISAARSVQEPLRVAFLGPEGTFTQQAALSLFGHSTPICAAETIEEVFSLVEKGVCQQGVIPIENSYEGSVNNTLDLLYKYDLKISAETFVRIRHHLLSRAESIEDIRRIYSHPMPIGQCRSWIRTHLKGIPVKEVESTSLAASLAAHESDAAAVGSRLSALTYSLNLLEEDIEDHPDNVTRFLAIGKTDSPPTGRDKTSILFFLKHKPGALCRALVSLSQNDINVSRIESRPMKTRNWEYLFFADLEGHEEDSNVHAAVKAMEECCVFMKRLGSYPAGGDP